MLSSVNRPPRPPKKTPYPQNPIDPLLTPWTPWTPPLKIFFEILGGLFDPPLKKNPGTSMAVCQMARIMARSDQELKD